MASTSPLSREDPVPRRLMANGSKDSDPNDSYRCAALVKRLTRLDFAGMS